MKTWKCRLKKNSIKVLFDIRAFISVFLFVNTKYWTMPRPSPIWVKYWNSLFLENEAYQYYEEPKIQGKKKSTLLLQYEFLYIYKISYLQWFSILYSSLFKYTYNQNYEMHAHTRTHTYIYPVFLVSTCSCICMNMYFFFLCFLHSFVCFTVNTRAQQVSCTI